MSTDTSPSLASAPLNRWVWPALAAVMFAAAAGLAALWWLGRPPADSDPAVTFARDMIAHHTQAVQMALILRDRTSDADLRQMALDIVLTQQAQIGQMQGWLEAWNLPFAGSRPPMSDHTGHGADMPPNMGMAAAADVDSLRSLPAADMEVKFLQLMIRHHQGGVYMSEFALRQTARPEVVRLAQSIIASQTKEISVMQDLLKARGATP